VSRVEKTWLLVASALVLMAAAAPFAIGWLSAPAGQPFSGLLVEREDGFSYLANMRLGAEGEWLFHDMYSVQPQPKVPLYSLFMLLGHIAAPIADARLPLTTLAVTYTVARIAFGALYLVVLYRFIAVFTEDVARRRVAWALIVVCAGLGWLMLFGERSDPSSLPSLDLYLGEANTIVPLLAYPHPLLARAALLAGVLCLIRAEQRRDWWLAWAAGGLWLAATLAVPFEVLIAGGMVGGWIIARWWSTRRLPWRLVGMGLVAGVPGAALNVVTLAMIGNDPTYAGWTAQNTLALPPASQFLATFGLQMALAIPGAALLWREKARHSDLLIGWAVVSPLLTLIPVPFQFRFIEGFTIPLGILASAALMRLAGRARLAALIGVFALLLPSSLLLIAGGGAAAAGGFGRFSAGQAAALEWLRTQAEPESVALSSSEFGVIIPAAAPLRAALGHGFETPDFKNTQEEVRRLYTGQMDQAVATAWLQAHHVRYVVFGPDEARLSGVESTPIVAELGLQQVFAQDDYHIYELRSP